MCVAGLKTASVSLAAFLIFLSGCDRSDEQIKVYRLAKPSDGSPATEEESAPAMNAPERSTIERVPAPATATTPPNWETQPLSQMRQASFLVHGENGASADISLVTLGPAAGNVLDNVNRWLGQLAQPPITADQLASKIQKLSTARGEVDVVDLSGQPENGDASKDGRIVGAIASDEGKISFFKMRGNSALVAAEKVNFLKWVSSLRDTSSANAANIADKPQIKWEVPAGWSPAPASAMRYASFTATGNAGDKIDISVVTFPGDGGSDADNVNRWRQQIGASSTAKSAEIVPLKTASLIFSTTDIVGAKARTLAAWSRHDGRAWFFKLTGPATAVEKEKPNFVKFVQSVRF